MFTKILKWSSIAALLLALLWRSSAGYQVLLQFVVSVSAFMVVLQARFAGKYFLMLVFLAIAVLFNPIVPIALSSKTFLLLDLSCLVMFGISLKSHARPRLSIPSITDRTPGSESL